MAIALACVVSGHPQRFKVEKVDIKSDGGTALRRSRARMAPARAADLSIGDWPCLAVMMRTVDSEKAARFECTGHLADRTVNEVDLALHVGRWRAGRIRVAAFSPVLDQLLPDADCLDIHPEDRRDRTSTRAEMPSPIDPVQHGIDLQLVVALNVREAVRPGATVRIGHGRARQPGSMSTPSSYSVRVPFTTPGTHGPCSRPLLVSIAGGASTRS
jgi:hypothetical protein